MAERPPLESFLGQPSSGRPPLENFMAAPPAGEPVPAPTPAMFDEFSAVPKPPTLLGSIAERISNLPPAKVPDWMPFVGGYQPSAVGMAKGAYEQAKSGATLPGDVYAGRTDPLSNEGISRSFQLASIIGTPAPQQISPGRRLEPLPSGEIQRVASAGYQAATREGRATPLATGEGQIVAGDIGQAIEAAAGPRPARAAAAHAEIGRIGQARDVGDLLDARQNLREMLGSGGPDSAAAAIALRELDNQIGVSAPNLMPQIRRADANWSAARGAQTVEGLIEQATRAGGRGRPLGTRLQEQFRPLYRNEDQQFGLRPMEVEAIGRVAQPGIGANLLRTGAAFDPTTSTIGPLLTAAGAVHNPWLLASMPAGFVSRAAYDRAIRNRARDVAELIRSRAPASMERTGPPSVLRIPGSPVNPLVAGWPALQQMTGYPNP